MGFTTQQQEAIKRSKQSVTWFLTHFGKVKHPSAGVLPFKPFRYQRTAIKEFRKNRMNIFRKCRQSGVSKISGAFALWFAMFHSFKNILIVSRKNEDAMSFLRDHIVFLFEHLPKWMQEAWEPTKQNEHEIVFPNGSSIRSLTSHPDVLRSQASSLNIIDEAAFIQGMDVMWAAGWPTLQHGGSVIAISTCNGIGNWYWSTWTDAEAGISPFNPVVINWWDMDWVIEYVDPISRKKIRIAPLDGIRPTQTKEEKLRYGQYWSPWLEEQWRALQEKGEGWKFEQEVLADFVGSGNTVLSKAALLHVGTTVKDDFRKVQGEQVYVHPVTGEQEHLSFDFETPDEGLWIWEEPQLAKPAKKRGDKIIELGIPAHAYVLGMDTATGQGRDYHAIEIFDVGEMKQVAEMMIRCLPRELVKYMDMIGRWYNCALAVIERNNGGSTIIDELRYAYSYPRIWRKKDINDKPRPSKTRMGQRALKVAPYGFATSQASKPVLNKFLVDFIRAEEDGGERYTLFSRRLLKQLHTYVRKKDRSGRDTGKTEAEEGAGNYDDLVVATALALMGAGEAFQVNPDHLAPANPNASFKSQTGPTLMSAEQMVIHQQEIIAAGGQYVMMPMSVAQDEVPENSAQRQLEAFTIQLGAIPMSNGRPLVTPPRYFYERKKN